MAQVTFAFARAGGRSGDSNVPVISPYPDVTGELASTGTSALATATVAGAVADRNHLAQITVVGGAVWVKFGTAPTAAVGDGYMILDGTTREFGPMSEGDTFAIIDDS